MIIKDIGFTSYEKALELQKSFLKKRQNNEIDDTLILVEHEPVYTLGKNADSNNILNNHHKDVKVFQVERGGDVTYHGPGQLVGYPIIKLQKQYFSVSRYVQTLEEILIKVLKNFGISSEIKKKIIGIWVDDKKVAAIGIRISRGVSMHGFALNVNTDLSYFDGIIPCGITDCKVTSMEQLLNKKIEIEPVKEIIVNEFQKFFKQNNS